MPEPTPPKLLTHAEAAAFLGNGVTEHWLRSEVRARRIPHTRLSDRIIRFTEADLLALLEQSRVEPTAAPQAPTGPTPTKARRSA